MWSTAARARRMPHPPRQKKAPRRPPRITPMGRAGRYRLVRASPPVVMRAGPGVSCPPSWGGRGPVRGWACSAARRAAFDTRTGVRCAVSESHLQHVATGPAGGRGRARRAGAPAARRLVGKPRRGVGAGRLREDDPVDPVGARKSRRGGMAHPDTGPPRPPVAAGRGRGVARCRPPPQLHRRPARCGAGGAHGRARALAAGAGQRRCPQVPAGARAGDAGRRAAPGRVSSSDAGPTPTCCSAGGWSRAGSRASRRRPRLRAERRRP